MGRGEVDVGRDAWGIKRKAEDVMVILATFSVLSLLYVSHFTFCVSRLRIKSHASLLRVTSPATASLLTAGPPSDLKTL